MRIDEDKLKQILLDESYVTEEGIEKAEEFAQEHDSSFAKYFLNKNILTRDLLGQAIAEAYGVPYADLNTYPPDIDVLEEITEEEARELKMVPYSMDEDIVKIATSLPDRLGLINRIEELFPDHDVKIMYGLPKDIEDVLTHYKKDLGTILDNIIEGSAIDLAPRFLEEIVKNAALHQASDIHFESYKEQVNIRFRVDGILEHVTSFPKRYYSHFLNHIRVRAGLPVDEHRRPQDGSIVYQYKDLDFDIRLSFAPMIEGEKLTMRLLADYMRGFIMSNLGLNEEHREMLIEAGNNPFGMILISGPTGSGKTTTLYSLLKLLNEVDINITTIEDPVEYRLKGVNQMQVNPQVGLTFAEGLKTIVRQDPDVVLVGEIRDQETSEIAVNAALTGHLMLSTFHANDAATTIPRLLDMGVEPFLLASTLEIIVTQRLVRTICKNCRQSKEVKKSEIKKEFGKVVSSQFDNKEITTYEGEGCSLCNDTGYKGRTGIFEFIEITPEMEDLILGNPSKKEIWKLAAKQGASSMFEDGIRKVEGGETTLEELTRVASPVVY